MCQTKADIGGKAVSAEGKSTLWGPTNGEERVKVELVNTEGG